MSTCSNWSPPEYEPEPTPSPDYGCSLTCLDAETHSLSCLDAEAQFAYVYGPDLYSFRLTRNHDVRTLSDLNAIDQFHVVRHCFLNNALCLCGSYDCT